MDRRIVPTYVLIALATYGVWTLWWPAYFLVLFPQTVMEVTARHFVLASSVSVVLAALWASFIRWIALPGLSGSGAQRQALGAAVIAFLTFMAPATRFLWLMYWDATARLPG